MFNIYFLSLALSRFISLYGQFQSFLDLDSFPKSRKCCLLSSQSRNLCLSKCEYQKNFRQNFRIRVQTSQIKLSNWLLLSLIHSMRDFYAHNSNDWLFISFTAISNFQPSKLICVKSKPKTASIITNVMRRIHSLDPHICWFVLCLSLTHGFPHCVWLVHNECCVSQMWCRFDGCTAHIHCTLYNIHSNCIIWLWADRAFSFPLCSHIHIVRMKYNLSIAYHQTYTLIQANTHLYHIEFYTRRTGVSVSAARF